MFLLVMCNLFIFVSFIHSIWKDQYLDLSSNKGDYICENVLGITYFDYMLFKHIVKVGEKVGTSLIVVIAKLKKNVRKKLRKTQGFFFFFFFATLSKTKMFSPLVLRYKMSF